jgi:ribonuclease VapC
VIVLDTSALMSILLQEAGAAACESVLTSCDEIIMSAATVAEALVVADRRGVGDAMRTLLDGLPINVHDVDMAVATQVATAYATWGKGLHPGGLNLLDCFAYALAAETGGALLFVGHDFSRTDAVCALPRPT